MTTSLVNEQDYPREGARGRRAVSKGRPLNNTNMKRRERKGIVKG